MKLNILILFGITILFIGTVVYQSAQFFDSRLHVVFCDVGQGDAVYIRTPDGTDIVVDGGPDDKVLDCLGDHRPFWDRTIELALLTHPHADHMTGITDIIHRFTVQEFITQPSTHTSDTFYSLTSTVDKKKVRKRDVRKNDRYIFPDGVEMIVLWPHEQAIQETSEDLNEDSIVVLLTYLQFSLLLTGDAESEVVNDILKEYPDITVLKLAHHGSQTGTNMDTFKKSKPDYAVITVGNGNRYGHPSKSVLDVLHHYKIPYKRTDHHGTVEVISDGYTTHLITDK